MIELVSYQEAMDEANQIRDGITKDRILMVVFAMSNCEVCKPWLEQVMEPISELMKADLTMVVVYIDQNDIVFPPPQVPSSYIFVPGNSKDQSIENKIKYLIENHLINIDCDMFFNKTLDSNIIIKKILDVWNSDPLNNFKSLLKSI
jgi:hypothetical protein